MGARPARVYSVFAIGRHPNIDQAGIDLQAGLPIDLETLRNAEVKVVRENIGLGDELIDDLFSRGGLKVNLDAFLASVGMRLGVTARPPASLTHHIVGKRLGTRTDVEARRRLQVH